MAELPVFLGNLQQLQSLSIGHAKLTEVPDFLANLQELQILDLSGNYLAELPVFLGNLEKLQSLDLSKNDLSEVPEFLSGFQQLQSLDLSDNDLANLPESLANLQELQSLDLSNTKLTELPKFLGDLQKLHFLYFFRTDIAELPEFLSNLQQLQSLHLSSNQLTKLPEFIGELTQLQFLALSNNKLAEVPKFLGNLQQLHFLDLSVNKISELPESLGNLQHLSGVNLGFNKLTGLPESLCRLIKLQVLRLYGNQLPFGMEAAFSSRDFQGIQKWLQASKTDRWAGKLVFLGDGGVGKTCLLHALNEEEMPESGRSTVSLERHLLKWTMKSASSAIEFLNIHAWDFGGQIVYRPAQQTFCTRGAIYLVLYHPKRDETRQSIRYWMQGVALRVAKAKFLIVATHGEAFENRKCLLFEEWDELKGLYPQQLVGDGVFVVDSFNGLGIEELRETIILEATKEDFFLRKQRADRKPLRDFLFREGGPPFIAFNHLLEEYSSFEANLIHVDPNITSLDQEDIEETLQELAAEGEILYHGKRPTLRSTDDPRALIEEMVLLAPERLGWAVARIVADTEVNRCQGVVTGHYLQEILLRDDAGTGGPFAEEIIPLILRGLQATYCLTPFTLYAESGDLEARYLVPDCVGHSRPDHFSAVWPDEPEEGEGQRVEIYQFARERSDESILTEPLNLRPTGLMFRLIAYLFDRTPGYLSGRPQDSVWWERGVVVDMGDLGRALLELRPDSLNTEVTTATGLTKLCYTFRGSGIERMIRELSGDVNDFVRNQFELAFPHKHPIDLRYNGHFAIKSVGMMEQMMVQMKKDVRIILREELQDHDLNQERKAPRTFSMIVTGEIKDTTRWTHVGVRLSIWCPRCRRPAHQVQGDGEGFLLETRKEWWTRTSDFLSKAAPFVRLIGLTAGGVLVPEEAAANLRNAGFDAGLIGRYPEEHALHRLRPLQPESDEDEQFLRYQEQFGPPHMMIGDPCRQVQDLIMQWKGRWNVVQGAFRQTGLASKEVGKEVWLCQECAAQPNFFRGDEHLR